MILSLLSQIEQCLVLFTGALVALYVQTPVPVQGSGGPAPGRANHAVPFHCQQYVCQRQQVRTTFFLSCPCVWIFFLPWHCQTTTEQLVMRLVVRWKKMNTPEVEQREV